jgi:predicted helicase
MGKGIEQLRSIKTFPSLVKYLRDELDWPIESDDFEDLTYDYEADELGIDAKTAAKIKEIKQLRPLATNQPWGIFFINFEPKRLPIVALRRILRSLVIKKRASAKQSQQATWHSHDLLFVSSYGEANERQISFAHFSQDSTMGDLPTLKVLGWDAQNTVLRLEDTHRTLKEKLRWPEDETDLESWRKTWASAFTLTYRYSIRTSKELSIELAKLASVIRARVNDVLAVESERGQLRQLYKAFQEALIHDLSEDDFADMYAQTIAYGLLSARVSRESGALVADNVADMVPVTNPFLKELMQTFLTVGGRRNNIDFDELGINEVVELLRQANMESVLKDFGDRNPNEDPVIHFYELFLKEYDPKKRMKRGVFYTPKPVVSFIVRSVDEILRMEFALEDGLADTTTWGEMAKRQKGFQIPKGISPDAPFVQLLDPATGTGTFLVEAIDVIYRTMRNKWSREGKNESKMRELWNDYVPRHLLTRLHGFELMMAPYAIAHMKIGLKLTETKYAFLSSERARIYLTNTLEEPKDFADYFEQMAPALAHEANAANKVKRNAPITVVIGNPPYSGISSNMTEHAQRLVDAYKTVDGSALNERKLWLQDDYVKFIRYGQIAVEKASKGILGYITNHGYLDNPTFRGMRQSLTNSFDQIRLLDLHGNANKKERSPDGSEDKNVFDIRQGVAICLAISGSKEPSVQHADLWGDREKKYAWLLNHNLGNTQFATLTPDTPYYFFEPQNIDCREEYERGWKITEMFPIHGVGAIMARDSLTVDLNAESIWLRVKGFASLPIEEARSKYELGNDARDWRVSTAQADVQSTGPNKKRVSAILYRPFDFRYTYYTGKSRGFYASPCEKVMRHLLEGNNKGIAVTRSVEIGRFEHVFCTNAIIGHHSVSLKEVNYLCPLWLKPNTDAPKGLLSVDTQPKPNLSVQFLHALASSLSLRQDRTDGLPNGLTPDDIFHYIYAILHSPTYRSRFAEFLKIDFPRIPLTNNVNLFRKICAKGADLVALHLLEAEYEAASWNQRKKQSPLNHFITHYTGSGTAEVAKGYPKYQQGSVFINPSRSFENVPEEVWNFQIGGYQVCDKWLKDRRGRILSEEDITHYQRVVIALKETIRLMAEIDEVIEAHGGWPLPGSQDAPKVEQDQSALPFA